ncbi:hypothetical protein D0A39_02730 [Xanthomonas campestris pv. campestris]|nr:hypothetical protein D0A39_02730 [Xanthomonas campestris pv. campestris]
MVERTRTDHFERLMDFLELAAADITALDDGQLRELVARLAEAELREQEISRSSVQAGGAQEAADGGLDVIVATERPLERPAFVPRANTGFQVKKHSMSRGNCRREMLEAGELKDSIKALADEKGAYIIVSGKDSCSATMYKERLAGMEEGLKTYGAGGDLHLDFYGADRLALWLKSHPGVALWAREKLGKPLAGWRPYGRWASTPKADKDEFLADAHPCVIDASSSDKNLMTVMEGIELVRVRLRSGSRAVRITGLSGLGKTRFAQALFEENVGGDALPATDVLYADLGEDLMPSASAVVTHLIANKLASYVVLDNCPPQTHRSLQKQLSDSNAPLRLLTIEYDISDDRPEETDVIHIEPGSEETVTTLLLRRYPKLNRFNAARIAEFACGNARLALALADRVEADETLTSFNDEQLFLRLFQQRKGESADLLRAATVLSLVYSFNVSREEHGDELGFLSAISEVPRADLQRAQAELLRRQLAQKRGSWRAVLPHALANRLARRALDDYEPEDINRELLKPGNTRLLQSCAHRLGYFHDNERARKLALTWVKSGAPLANLATLSDDHLVVLNYVAPIFPDVLLGAIEQSACIPGFADRANPNVQRFVSLLVDLAYDDEAFDRSASILLKIARTERHGENNNSAVGRLRQLHQLHLSGTRAGPARRQALVRRLLATGERRDREIAGELLRAAFEAWSWTSFGGFKFGARNRGPGWGPETRQERRDWYDGFLALLDPVLEADDDSREWAKSLIAATFRQLWTSAGCFDALESLVSTYGASGRWPAIWLAIGQTLEYDGAGLDPAVSRRLEGLQSLAAPSNLESEIGAYAFVNEWAHPHRRGADYQAEATELRDHVFALGRALASDPSLFEHLAPQIWATRVRPVAWLGYGYAEAYGDLEALFEMLIRSFKAHAPDRVSLEFIEGCLSATAECDPALLPRMQEKLLAEPELKPYSVWLLLATPITPWVSARLLDVARQGSVPAGYFEKVGNGRRHESMTDLELSALTNAVCHLPEGYHSAFDMLIMRLHARTEWNYTPGPEIFSAIRTALDHLLRDQATDANRSAHHGMGPLIVEALGPGAPEDEVAELVGMLCNGLKEYRLSWANFSEVASAFIDARPEMLLDTLLEIERDDPKSDAVDWLFRQRSGEPSPSLNLASVDRLLTWCGKDAQRQEFVARNIRVYEATNGSEEDDDSTSPVRLSKHFKKLLDVVSDKSSLIKFAIGQAVPNSWMNSRVPIIEARQQALRDLLTHESPEVRDLVANKVADLDLRIELERRREESEHHAREQRFE